MSKKESPKDKKRYLMAIAGLSLGLLSIIYINVLVQAVILFIFFNDFIHFEWNFLLPVIQIIHSEMVFTPVLINMLLPYILAIVMIELLNLVLGALKDFYKRTIVLFYQFTLVSFLLFSSFGFIIAILTGWNINHNWTMTIQHLPKGFGERIFFAFFTAAVTFGYTGFILGRLKNLFSNPGEITNDKKDVSNEKTTK